MTMTTRSITIGAIVLVCLLAVRITAREQADSDTFPNIVDHFKYGSIGTEERVGIPSGLWRALPIVFADKLPNRPGNGYERLGFVYDSAPHKRPIGTSYLSGKVPLVGLNCATCHTGTIRFSPNDRRQIPEGSD